MSGLKRSVGLCLSLLLVLALSPVHAALIDAGDLTIIDDPGNPSDGLRYLDLSYSDGLSLADALANAQLTYANARLATPSEWDDLFDASTLVYDGAITASDAFEVGGPAILSSGSNYNTSLRDLLGTTLGSGANIWSDPDGSGNTLTTRDFWQLGSSDSEIGQLSLSPPHSIGAWLLVSEPANPIPAPGALILALTGLASWRGLARRRR